jgi:hypothetical protein
MFVRLSSVLVVCLFMFGRLQSQTQPAPASTANQVIGEVTAINTASSRISIKTDKGEPVEIITATGTSFRKVPAGAQSMSAAVRTDFASVSVGDRVLAAGQWSADRSKIDARAVVVMSRSELDEKRRAEQEDWRKRGTSGTVVLVDAEGKSLTISAASKKVVVQLGPDTQIHRYAPDSVRFSDARPSSLVEIKPGDQVRLLGTRSADGLSYAAERIISGFFLQFAATISSTNLQAGELVVKDLATKKSVIVRINADSVLRRLPPPIAASLAARYRQNGGRGAGGEPGRGGASEDLGQALDHLPAMPVAELKTGDAIMLSSTQGAEPGRVTAVMLLAGVEPLLTASPNATRDIMSGWNLGADSGQ